MRMLKKIIQYDMNKKNQKHFDSARNMYDLLLSSIYIPIPHRF
jgi:hypothetical protein